MRLLIWLQIIAVWYGGFNNTRWFVDIKKYFLLKKKKERREVDMKDTCFCDAVTLF